jgi:Cu/Ag efflux protein CusF
MLAAAAGAAFAAFAWFMLPTPPRPEPRPAPGGHAGHAGDPAAVSDGVVVSVDRAAKSITISHGALLNLGMPPMTMAFRAGDAVFPEHLKPGDRINFHADAIGGVFTASNIEIAN